MDLKHEIAELLKKIGPGHMMTTAYDTAWIARLAELGDPIGDQAFEWLREHQLPDGSWGASEPVYYHDRVISTLAAINALAHRSHAQDRERLRRAEVALSKAVKRLNEDPAGETIGFEMIVPALFLEAKALGAISSEELDMLGQLNPRRAAKLAALPEGIINRNVTLAFSAEMAGLDGRQLFDVDNLQEADGSVSFSPSATAYFALYIRHRDPAALEYLHRVTVNGAAPNVAPFDIFEAAWTLWNLSLVNDLDEDLLRLCRPHLDFLEASWLPGAGAGFSADYAAKDADGTSMVYKVLTHFGRSVDLDALLHYEEETYFRCFTLEANPSVSANIHILNALRAAQSGQHHPSVQKVLTFLLHARTDSGFWFDKWHASPYYATAHAVIACAGYSDYVAQDAVKWILATQNKNGSWGYYMPTAEETAYCLQALTVWEHQNGQVPDHTLKRAAAWLRDHTMPPYPPLWIGKCLYCPEMVILSAILSALILVDHR